MDIINAAAISRLPVDLSADRAGRRTCDLARDALLRDALQELRHADKLLKLALQLMHPVERAALAQTSEQMCIGTDGATRQAERAYVLAMAEARGL